MRLLRHITVALFTICVIVIVLVIICSLLDNSFITLKFKRQYQLTKDLYPSFLTLLDLWHFKYIINNDVCTSKDTNVFTTILIITSHAGDMEGRNAIRRVYPKEELGKLGIRRVFLLALINAQNRDEYKSVPQKEIFKENEHFADLVQGNFYEAYRNLTYKHVMGLQWAAMYCQNAKYIIKMDDDIIVDFYRLMDIITPTAVSATEILMGYVLRGMKPVRDNTNKWFVTNKEYAKALYPPFLSGWMYITTPATAYKLLQASKIIKFFWIDDTFVTGILAKWAGVKHMDISDIFTVHPEFLECCLDGKERRKFSCDFIVGPSGGDYDLLLRFQKHAAACYIRKCPNRQLAKSLNKKCISKGKLLPLQKGKGKIVPYKLV